MSLPRPSVAKNPFGIYLLVHEEATKHASLLWGRSIPIHPLDKWVTNRGFPCQIWGKEAACPSNKPALCQGQLQPRWPWGTSKCLEAKIYPCSEGNCAAIEREQLSSGNVHPVTFRCLSGPSGSLFCRAPTHNFHVYVFSLIRGTIPQAILLMSSLNGFDVNENMLMGTIPSWLRLSTPLTSLETTTLRQTTKCSRRAGLKKWVYFRSGQDLYNGPFLEIRAKTDN